MYTETEKAKRDICPRLCPSATILVSVRCQKDKSYCTALFAPYNTIKLIQTEFGTQSPHMKPATRDIGTICDANLTTDI